ncbi:hypothetical protein H0H92_003504 [Tricholoma furcatifolium]|nr:hypothetical protein H0H92_003504 [Tricholoma furcatifolium]
MSYFGPNVQRSLYSNSRVSPSKASLHPVNPGKPDFGRFIGNEATFNKAPRSKPSALTSGFNSIAPIYCSVLKLFQIFQQPERLRIHYPAAWGSELFLDHPECDDDIHNPDPRRDRKNDQRGIGDARDNIPPFSSAGYPIISHFTTEKQSMNGGFNLGGINATGQIPSMSGNWGLIDLETPKDVYAKPSYTDPANDFQLVFSDEFNTDGRTFYPGDDPYWEAVNLHYWATNNMEWYDPAAITTKDGALEITLSQKETHGLKYEGGMMTTWNKFCFTGGMIEASVSLPGANNVVGLWPAIWTMGNLGRAGYGASLEGMWPYTYDSCDVGTVSNQTVDGLPQAATVDGDPKANGALSFLPGQRLSRCTCPGESHPGPVHSDGTFVGRSSPEIDVFEAQVSGQPLTGQVSQSAQWAVN